MLTVRFKKIWADFRERKGRTALTLLGLILGLWGLGTVLTAFGILADDMNANYRQTRPPHIVMDTEAVPDEVMKVLPKAPGVTAVERRDVFSGRIKTGEKRRLPIRISVIEDFEDQTLARVYSESGAWPPPRGTILIERDGRFFLRRQVGDKLDLILSNGQSVAPELSGFAFDPGTAPSRMELMLYGFVTRETWSDWDPEASASRSRVLFASDSEKPAGDAPGHGGHGHGAAPPGTHPDWAVAEHLKLVFNHFNIAVHGTRVLDPAKHPHQFQLDAIAILLAGLGVVALLMCIALIVNLIDAILASETRAIGILKAIGASPGAVARDYLLAMAALGALAAVVAAPLAVRMGHAIARFIAGFLNFEILGEHPPGLLYLILFLVGATVPMLAALPSVIRASRIPVRAALGHVGISQRGQDFLSLSRWWLPLPLITRMALRNVFRKPRRSLLTALTLAFGLTFFLAALNNHSTLLQTVVTVRETKPHDLTMWLQDGYPRQRLDEWLRGYPEVRDVEYWSAIRATVSPLDGVQREPTLVYAVPLAPTAIRPRLLAGRWLDPANPAGIVVTQGVLAQNTWMELGGAYRLAAGGRELVAELIGVVKEFGPGVIYMPDTAAAELAMDPDAPNVALIDLKSSVAAGHRHMTGQLETDIERDGWRVARLLPAKLLALIVENHLDVIAKMLLIIAGLMLTVGVLGLASSISVNVVERFREIAVLKAVGGQAGTIRALFVSEALFLAGFAWALALALAPMVSRGIAKYFGELILQYPLDYRAATWGAVLALLIAMLAALLAAALPTRAAVKRTVHDALHYE